MIKQKDGTFVEDTTNCDGTNGQAIIDGLECFIPMQTLRDPNAFNLVLGDLVVAQVVAVNQKGYGQFSGTNVIGAYVESIPQKPAYPPTRGGLTD